MENLQNETPSVPPKSEAVAVDVSKSPTNQAAGAFALAHRAILTSLGTVSLSIEQVQSIFDRAAERGEQVETDTHRAIGGMRKRVTEGAASARSSASTRTAAAVSSSMASLLNKLPGVSLTYRGPAEVDQNAANQRANQEPGEQNA
jgi:hypothetical protein